MESFEPSATLGERLSGAARVLVLTGAGVSAESGLATFRGPGGLWEGLDPTRLATREAFERDPVTVWRFYAWRRSQAAAASPNAAHRAIAALERSRPAVDVVTQNVDGLLERAGCRRVILLHGTLWRLRCTAEGTEAEDQRGELGPLPPRCACGAILRPAVVWFGEPLPAGAYGEAEAAARHADLVLVVGTSGLVVPAALLPEIALAGGAYVVEVNPERTALSPRVQERLAGPAGEILPLLVEAAGFPREPAP